MTVHLQNDKTLQVVQVPLAKQVLLGAHRIGSQDPVDGRNPAPVDMVSIPLLTGFYTSQVVVNGISSINSMLKCVYTHIEYCIFNIVMICIVLILLWYGNVWSMQSMQNTILRNDTRTVETYRYDIRLICEYNHGTAAFL